MISYLQKIYSALQEVPFPISLKERNEKDVCSYRSPQTIPTLVGHSSKPPPHPLTSLATITLTLSPLTPAMIPQM
jgi:hypothetical protein